MKGIYRFHDLEAFGFIPLTGEADSTLTRYLFDLTATGVRTFCKAFGLRLPHEFDHTNTEGKRKLIAPFFAENWNSGSKTEPHIASVLLPHYSGQAISHLSMWALGEDGAKVILMTEKNGVTGLYEGDDELNPDRYEEYVAAVRKHYGITHIVKGWKGVRNDHQQEDRNVHVMSGRSI